MAKENLTPRTAPEFNAAELAEPNEVTYAAFAEGERMLRDPAAKHFSSVDELFAELDAE